MDGPPVEEEASGGRRPSVQEEDALKPKDFFVSERYQPFTVYEKARKVVQWRMQQRMKTVSVLLTLCLNIGVDPPDIVKSSPCARLECWIDPHAFPPQKAIEQIGKALQTQYERWQPRARYKLCLDPDDEAVKKLSISLRRNAKDERVLFHYNGHGVPKPTNNGEIWVFNKNYTQYIPLSLYELQSWIGVPSIFVFDCSAAGMIVHWFNKFSEQRDQEELKATRAVSPPPPMASYVQDLNNAELQEPLEAPPPPLSIEKSKDYILLAACGVHEILPSSADLPADLFTACLTTPITIAFKWFCTQTIITGITPDLIDKIPGRANDRRTAMGELNWIFTAITDTIAWNVLPTKLFQKLFREDLLVASLFRNYLLAERIMRSCKCTPQSYPKLPVTYNHPMWAAWDLEADHCLSQLLDLVNDPDYEYKHSSFFTEQLTAFEVWLEFGTEHKKPPLQLPIVLQVLLSQQHRQRALELLAQFLDLGSWAVNYALSVGIFPYVLKLLQSPASELRQVLVFIWAKILVLDKSCQFDLVKDNGQHYFISVLSNASVPVAQRQQSAFILSVICSNCRPGQSACQNAKLMKICLANLNHHDALLRRWVVLCLAKLWEHNENAKKEAIIENAHVQLCGLLTDPVPEVRGAAVYALGTFITKGPASSVQNTAQRSIIELNLGLTFAVVTADASTLVRKELMIALASLVSAYEEKFKQTEAGLLRQEYNKKLAEVQGNSRLASSDSKKNAAPKQTPTARLTMSAKHSMVTGSLSEASALGPLDKAGSKKEVSESSSKTDPEEDQPKDEDDDAIYLFLWRGVLSLMNDPYPPIARMCKQIVSKVRTEAKSELAASGIRLPAETRSAPMVKPAQTRLGFLGKPNSLPPPKPGTASPSSGSANDRSDSIPIKSTFYDWSANYFSQQLFLSNEDQTAPKFTEKKWRLQRNNDLMRECTHYDTKPSVQSLDNEIAILENNNQLVSALAFHPFEDTVIVSDEHDGISVWNWKEGMQVNHFSNLNPVGTRVTCLNIFNEHSDKKIIGAGSDDGVLRIWSLSNEDHENKEKVKLITAWRVLDDLVPVRGLSGLVLDWQKKKDTLIAAGNVDVIKVWDLNKELAVQDIPTESQSCVTCLTSDKNAIQNTNLIIAGCADHSLRIFDRRLGPKNALTHSITDYKGWIVNAFMPPLLNHQIIAGAANGEVKIWDLRATAKPTKTFVAHANPTMFCFTVHNYAPLFAIGTQDQRIRVMNFNGEEISLIRYHDGFLGQRIGPVSALTFHPYKVMLAAGATDSIVSIYTGETHKANAGK